MKILITRPRAQADEFAAGLSAAGFEAYFFPVIEIRPIQDNNELESALKRLSSYDWVIFTSVNGVEAVGAQMDRMQMQALPESVRVAAIGPKTAEALRARAIEPSFMPDEYVAEAIMPGLGELKGRWVLLPRAEIARQALPQAISQAGGVAHEIAVYRTLPAKADPQGLARLRAGVDVVTLTSPSTVENFAAITRQHGLDPHNLPGNPVFACIGPITEQAARDEGLSGLIVAQEFTTEGLIRAIRTLPPR